MITSLALYFQRWYSFDVNVTYDLISFSNRSSFYSIIGLNNMNGPQRLGGFGANIGLGFDIESRVYLESKVTLERLVAPGVGLSFGVYFNR